MARWSHVRNLWRDTRGTAVLELALLAPLLVGLMVGLAEFGLALRQYHIMEKGVRDAARYLSHVPANPACSGVTDPAGYTWSQAKTDAKNLALYGSITGSTPLYNTWSDPATITIDDGTCVANPRGASALPLPKITVTASATFADLGLIGALGFSAPTLTVSHQELKVF
jgi:Flp pilus assembly protein TadG